MRSGCELEKLHEGCRPNSDDSPRGFGCLGLREDAGQDSTGCIRIGFQAIPTWRKLPPLGSKVPTMGSKLPPMVSKVPPLSDMVAQVAARAMRRFLGIWLSQRVNPLYLSLRVVC